MAGQREQKTPGSGKKTGLIIGGIVGVLLAAYLGLCFWVGHNRIVMPNVTVAGLDVSGMSWTDVERAVAQAVQENSDDAVITLNHGDWEQTLSAADLVIPHAGYAQNAGLAAVRVGRENFFTQGYQYIRHLLGASSEVDIVMAYFSTEQPALDDLLNAAQGVLGSDSTAATCAIEGDRLVMVKGITDVTIDRAETHKAVYAAFEQQVFPALFRGEQPDVTVELVASERPPQTPDFDTIHDAVYAEVTEPVYDKTTGTVSDHMVGFDFDVNILKSAYEAAAEGETFSIPLVVTQPKDTKQSFEAKLFADVLGVGDSKVSGSSNRKQNVKLSAAACDGVILLPGEEFSYNNTTGSRTADKGYLPAPTYNAGASVDDVGGGICQTSSTIYYALLHTTLEIVERANHSYATGYVPDGMDATVFFGVTDFRFKNNTNYPIKIDTESYDKNGVRRLKVTLYGTNEDGRYAVPSNYVFEEVLPDNKYVPDETVPQGSLVLDSKQNAYRGRKAQVFRTIYEADGTKVETQDLGVSRYKMRSNLYYYNPLDGDPASWPNGVPPTPVTPDPEPVIPETPVTPVEPVQPEVPAEPTQPAEPVEGTAESTGETAAA